VEVGAQAAACQATATWFEAMVASVALAAKAWITSPPCALAIREVGPSLSGVWPGEDAEIHRGIRQR
jgi:hypothetical protein